MRTSKNRRWSQVPDKSLSSAAHSSAKRAAKTENKPPWKTYCFFAFTIVCWLTGCALIGVGVWVVGGSAKLSEAYAATFPADRQIARGTNICEKIRMLGVAAMVFGSVDLILGFIGFEKGRAMMFSLLAIFVILFILVVASGIFVSIFGETLTEWLEASLQFEIRKNEDLQNGLLIYANSEFNCCGVKDESACLKNYPPYTQCFVGSANCTTGCLGALSSYLNRMKFGLGTTLLASSVPMLSGMIISLMRLMERNI